MSQLITQTWKELCGIQIGGAICLPVIMAGQALGQTYGLMTALAAIVIGNIILALMGMIASRMSIAEKKTTVEHAKRYFGKKGSSLFAWIFIVVYSGWFAIQLDVMGLSMGKILEDYVSLNVSPLLNVALGLLITCVAMYGIQSMSLLSKVSVPILVLTISYALLTIEKQDVALLPKASGLGAISIVLAIAIGAIVDLPNYFRHARSQKDGVRSILIIFGLALPLIEISGVYLAHIHPSTNILELFLHENAPIWNIWILCFLLLAGWTTNNTNLYSSSVCLHSIFPKIEAAVCTLVIGVAGTILSLLPLLEHFVTVLDILGVGISSMGAIMMVGYLLDERESPYHYISLGIGILTGLLSTFHLIVLTEVPVLDAFLAGALSVLCIRMRRRYYVSNPS